MAYREPLDSNLERELLMYTLDTGSPLVRELKPLLFPIADNALQARQLFQKHEIECREWRDHVKRELAELKELGGRVDKLEDADEITGVQAIAELKQQNAKLVENATWWKRWALGIAASLLVAGLSAGAGYALKGAVSSASAASR